MKTKEPGPRVLSSSPSFPAKVALEDVDGLVLRGHGSAGAVPHPEGQGLERRKRPVRLLAPDHEGDVTSDRAADVLSLAGPDRDTPFDLASIEAPLSDVHPRSISRLSEVLLSMQSGALGGAHQPTCRASEPTSLRRASRPYRPRGAPARCRRTYKVPGCRSIKAERSSLRDQGGPAELWRFSRGVLDLTLTSWEIDAGLSKLIATEPAPSAAHFLLVEAEGAIGRRRDVDRYRRPRRGRCGLGRGLGFVSAAVVSPARRCRRRRRRPGRDWPRRPLRSESGLSSSPHFVSPGSNSIRGGPTWGTAVSRTTGRATRYGSDLPSAFGHSETLFWHTSTGPR